MNNKLVNIFGLLVHFLGLAGIVVFSYSNIDSVLIYNIDLVLLLLGVFGSLLCAFNVYNGGIYTASDSVLFCASVCLALSIVSVAIVVMIDAYFGWKGLIVLVSYLSVVLVMIVRMLFKIGGHYE